MNREILFRGRDDKGIWHIGSLIVDYYGRFNIWTPYEDPKGSHLYDNKIYGELNLVDPETVGEYTGIPDRNGTKIFEDDFIRFHDGGTKIALLVEFENSQWLCRRTDIWEYYMHRLECDNPQKYEVAGNIHDNPELLEIGIKDIL